MAEETHRVIVELPKSWLPELEEISTAERRSRHSQILQFIEQGIEYHRVLRARAERKMLQRIEDAEQR
jgi:metal-responsive CopG/Arc/MetJ family transcriptional regulator